MFISYDDSTFILVTKKIKKYFFDKIVTALYFLSSYQCMTFIEDQHYINLILNGNTNSFATLVDRYKDMVYTLALKMLNNKEEAEEIAQDTFIKVFNSLSKFKGESKFSTWVYKVTYNTCLDALKKKKKQNNVAYIEDFSEHQTKKLEGILDNIDEKERNRAIQDCLEELPSDEAFLLTLYYFDDKSIEEVAKVVNISTDNVKIKLFRTRKKLATILKKRLEPEMLDYYEYERR
ncbi:RNA polymerase, sigma subunit, ECF family [Flavobacterium terrae]|uniref:RNA polymerase, sigma subunit, ECF family n=2 Tax=Flavobacterium terrae TaxID=415425 RepID=A0A1M6BBQ9_9FLAO|nr:RNA polymerase, sigma subunit, ECF family [Flavobacterium terrae]